MGMIRTTLPNEGSQSTHRGSGASDADIYSIPMPDKLSDIAPIPSDPKGASKPAADTTGGIWGTISGAASKLGEMFEKGVGAASENMEGIANAAVAYRNLQRVLNPERFQQKTDTGQQGEFGWEDFQRLLGAGGAPGANVSSGGSSRFTAGGAGTQPVTTSWLMPIALIGGGTLAAVYMLKRSWSMFMPAGGNEPGTIGDPTSGFTSSFSTFSGGGFTSGPRRVSTWAQSALAGVMGPPAGGYGSSRGMQTGVGSGVGGLGSPAAATFAAANQSVAWASGTWGGGQMGFGASFGPKVGMGDYGGTYGPRMGTIDSDIRRASAEGALGPDAAAKAQAKANRAARARASRAEGAAWGRSGVVPVRGPGTSSRGDQGLGGGFQGQGPTGFHPMYGGEGVVTNIRTTTEGRNVIMAQLRVEAARMAGIFQRYRETDRRRTLANRAAERFGLVKRRPTYRSPAQTYALPAAGYIPKV